MVNADEVDEDDEEEYNSYPIGDQIFRVSTAGTEEKTNALSMLTCYAEHMGEHFAPYCMDIAGIAEHVLSAPLLNTELMRRTCAALVPQLLRCMQAAAEKKTWAQATPESVQGLFELLMKGLLSVRRPALAHAPALGPQWSWHVRRRSQPAAAHWWSPRCRRWTARWTWRCSTSCTRRWKRRWMTRTTRW